MWKLDYINAIKLKLNWNNPCLEFGINIKNPSIGFSTRVHLWQALFQMTTHLKLYLRRKKTSKEAKTWTRKEKFWFNFFFLLFHELLKTLISRNIEKWISSTKKVFSKKIENLYANVQKTQLVTLSLLLWGALNDFIKTLEKIRGKDLHHC
jgi:hypothetical protein